MQAESGSSLESNVTSNSKNKRIANKLSIISERVKNKHYSKYMSNGNKLLKLTKECLRESGKKCVGYIIAIR